MKLLKCSAKVSNISSMHQDVTIFFFFVFFPFSENINNLFSFFSNMIGVEYILLHVQDPILYVIRKQHRHSPTEATPMADYYIIAGTIYQAPDLANVFNSRLVCGTIHLYSRIFHHAFTQIFVHSQFSYQQFTICKALSKRPHRIHVTIQTKAIPGIFRQTKHVSLRIQFGIF